MRLMMSLVAAAVVLANLMAGDTVVPSIDRAAAEAAIIKADEAFCQAVADHDLARFKSLIAEDATFGQPGARQHGREAVARAWAPFFQEGGPTLTWKPVRSGALVGGAVGFTTGAWERRVVGAGGKPVVTHGEYLTVWGKQQDGRWQVLVDTGSDQPDGL